MHLLNKSQNKFGLKPLYYAANGGNLELFKSIFIEDECLTFYLSKAVYNGHFEIVKWIIDNFQDKYPFLGKMALPIATRCGRTGIADYVNSKL